MSTAAKEKPAIYLAAYSVIVAADLPAEFMNSRKHGWPYSTLAAYRLAPARESPLQRKLREWALMHTWGMPRVFLRTDAKRLHAMNSSRRHVLCDVWSAIQPDILSANAAGDLCRGRRSQGAIWGSSAAPMKSLSPLGVSAAHLSNEITPLHLDR